MFTCEKNPGASFFSSSTAWAWEFSWLCSRGGMRDWTQHPEDERIAIWFSFRLWVRVPSPEWDLDHSLPDCMPNELDFLCLTHRARGRKNLNTLRWHSFNISNANICRSQSNPSSIMEHIWANNYRNPTSFTSTHTPFRTFPHFILLQTGNVMDFTGIYMSKLTLTHNTNLGENG